MAAKSVVSSLSNPFIINPTVKHTSSFIFLHGLGDTGEGWCQGFKTSPLKHVKYIFPNAPIQPVTINMGARMPSWFDIKSLIKDTEEDTEGIKNASGLLKTMIDDEIKAGIDVSRILVGGFSQGGAVSVYTCLSNEFNLAGLVLLSSYLPLASSVTEYFKCNPNIPIFQAHGDADMVVMHKFGKATNDGLKNLMKNVEFKTYKNLGHSSSPEEFRDVNEFIKKILPSI